MILGVSFPILMILWFSCGNGKDKQPETTWENEEYKGMLTQVQTQVYVPIEMEIKIWCTIKKYVFKHSLEKLELFLLKSVWTF